MPRSLLLTGLLTVLVGAVLPVSVSSAAAVTGQACNLRGSWVATTPQANRYFRAINPTTTRFTVTSGALSATFDRGKFTFGSIGLKLKGLKGATTIKQELDLQAVAPYTPAAGRLSLGPGSYKLHYISTVIKTSSGVTVPIRLPNVGARTPRSAFPYSCTPSSLRLRVPAGGTGGVILTLQRDRG